MRDEESSANRAGRWLGGLMFALGTVLLIAVFVLAAKAFSEVPEALAGSGDLSAPALGVVLGAAAVRAGFLFVMAYVSSLVASKGLELYQAARGQGAG